MKTFSYFFLGDFSSAAPTNVGLDSHNMGHELMMVLAVAVGTILLVVGKTMLHGYFFVIDTPSFNSIETGGRFQSPNVPSKSDSYLSSNESGFSHATWVFQHLLQFPPVIFTWAL